MNIEDKKLPIWVIALVIVLLPIALVAMFVWGLYSLSLYLLVWSCWLTRGRDIFFVYSDSPHWKDFIESEVLPRIEGRAIILNWSERRKWLEKFSLESLVFTHFGGHKKFNPLGLYFKPFRFVNSYRFFEPFHKWRKKDDKEDLDYLLASFYTDTGINNANKPVESTP